MKLRGRQNARLLAAMMVTSLVVTSHAWQPVYRTRRRYRPEVPVRVRAFPHDVTLYPGSSVSVRCRIRVASWALKSLHVGFYMYYDSDTTLPMASNIPGVSVRPWPLSTSWFRPDRLPESSRPRYSTIGRLLTIGWPTYRFIPPGTNLFCCSASIVVNATSEGSAVDESGSGDVDNDVTLKPTRKFYSSYFRLHKVRF